jgi:hypothetical protein
MFSTAERAAYQLNLTAFADQTNGHDGVSIELIHDDGPPGSAEQKSLLRFLLRCLENAGENPLQRSKIRFLTLLRYMRVTDVGLRLFPQYFLRSVYLLFCSAYVFKPLKNKTKISGAKSGAKF